MKKVGIVLLTLALLALLGGSVGALLLSQKMYAEVKDITAYVEEQREAALPKETSENDVKIAGNYEIKATTAISDAYKSGDVSELDDKQKETLDMASGILKEIITDGMTDFDKEKAVYDWMCKNLARDVGLLTVIPSTSADCDNPYGVLKYHNAVCVGYATTFRLFMQMMDIECMVVHNSECYHSWDLVKIEDSWYHTDIYADVGSGKYTNFNVSDNMRSRQQTWDTSFFPRADSLKYNMAMINHATVDDIFEIPQTLYDCLENRQGSIFIKINGEMNEERAQRAVKTCQLIDDYVMNNWDSLRCYIGQYSFVPGDNDGEFLLWVTTDFYDDNTINTNNSLTEDEINKVNEKIYNIFSQPFNIEGNTDTTNAQ